jgi:SAM-dependent methyltransferase
MRTAASPWHGTPRALSLVVQTLPSETSNCLVCGVVDADLIADHRSVRDEVEALWAYHARRLRAETPPTRLMDRVTFSENPPLRVVRCRRCGLVYRSPAEPARDLVDAYRRASPSADALRSLHSAQYRTARSQARRLRHALGRRCRGLEVGCYAGAFLAAARDDGLMFEGLDVSPAVNDFTRSLGFAVHDGDFANYRARRSYDVVAIWNTFDQLGDPRAAAEAAWRILRPNGILALRVPNGGLYARLRSDLESKSRFRRIFARSTLAQNNLLSFPYRFGFTPGALGRLVRSVGFRVAGVEGDVLPRLADEWTRPWARAEELVFKHLLRSHARQDPSTAPWFELYARRIG